MLREQEKELRETEEKRTRLVKEVWTGSPSLMLISITPLQHQS